MLLVYYHSTEIAGVSRWEDWKLDSSPLSAAEVSTVIQQARAGNPQAVFELVERYRDRVFRFCFRMLGQRQDAEDMAQESLTRLVDNLDRWDSQRPFEPWLFTIVANRCRSFLASSRRRLSSMPLSPDDITDTSWVDQAAVGQLAEEVSQAMQLLRPELRDALTLFHEQQCSYEELAHMLGIPAGTAKTWVHRARKQMIESLKRRGVVE